jgi:hypothetical protein
MFILYLTNKEPIDYFFFEDTKLKEMTVVFKNKKIIY